MAGYVVSAAVWGARFVIVRSCVALVWVACDLVLCAAAGVDRNLGAVDRVFLSRLLPTSPVVPVFGS